LREKWRSDDGGISYSHKNSVYRPTVRITAQTPTTFGEHSKEELQRPNREKAKTGRVKRFKQEN
jgi:ABC-type iron transport system FetAB ATPase subunit